MSCDKPPTSSLPSTSTEKMVNIEPRGVAVQVDPYESIL
jgi:hypothetical protein